MAQRTLAQFKHDFGFSADSIASARGYTNRRGPDEATTRVFKAIHQNRSSFSISAVSAAFSKVKPREIG
jgi:hypothetical protein